MVFYE